MRNISRQENQREQPEWVREKDHPQRLWRVRDIEATVEEIYGANVSQGLISKITDKILVMSQSS